MDTWSPSPSQPSPGWDGARRSIYFPAMRRTGLATLLLPALACARLLPSVPLDDPDTDLLLRLEGISGCELDSYRPWPGEKVQACVDSLVSSPEVDPQDRARLLSMRRRLFPGDSTWGSLSWMDGDRMLRLDAGVQAFAHADRERTGAGISRSDTIGRDIRAGLRVRPLVEVLLGPDVALWSRPMQLAEISPDRRYDKESDAADGVYQTALFAGPGGLSRGRTTDWLEGLVEARGAWGRISAGLEPVLWGDLPVEPLMFSGRTSPFPVVRWVQSVGPIQASVLYGQPIGSTWQQDVRLYAHRVAWATPGLTLGFSEASVSSRGFQPLYLVPVFPYVMTEHLLGDPDNKQADLDFAWRWRPDAELSAELFIDDLQNALGFLSSGWGNKWGLGLGLRLRDWTGPRSLDRLQATRMEPWAGTASAAILPGRGSNAPVDFGVPLGWVAGPNSGQLDWIHSQDLSQRWSWRTSLRASWKGTDSGSSVRDLNWRDSSGTWVPARLTKRWLGGSVIDRQDLTLGAQYRPGGPWRISADAGIARLSVPGREARWIPSCAAEVSWNE